MTGTNILAIILVIALAGVYILFIVAMARAAKKGTASWIATTIVTLLGLLYIGYLSVNLNDIEPGVWAQILLLLGLVVVTGMYALSTQKQAGASVKMAEEMREQRRPIVVPKAFPAIGVPLQASVEEIEKHVYSDYFEIYNKGNSPAINLEVLLLNQEKSHLGNLKETVFSQDDNPLIFDPSGLENHLNSTCYLVCRYCSVLPANADKKWYESWLSFIPKKSQRGDQIIIVPGELEFIESSEKKSY